MTPQKQPQQRFERVPVAEVLRRVALRSTSSRANVEKIGPGKRHPYSVQVRDLNPEE